MMPFFYHFWGGVHLKGLHLSRDSWMETSPISPNPGHQGSPFTPYFQQISTDPDRIQKIPMISSDDHSHHSSAQIRSQRPYNPLYLLERIDRSNIYQFIYIITMSINLGAKLVNAAQPLGFMCPNPIRLVGPSETQGCSTFKFRYI